MEQGITCWAHPLATMIMSCRCCRQSKAPCSLGCNAHSARCPVSLVAAPSALHAIRASDNIRVVRPDLVDNFAQSHDQGLWQCLCTIMDVPEDGDPVTSHCQSAPLSWRVGFEERAAHTGGSILGQLAPSCGQFDGTTSGRRFMVAKLATRQPSGELDGLHGFEVPSWSDVAGGLRPPDRDPEDHEPGGSRKGWQHETSSRVVRSQSAPGGRGRILGLRRQC